MPVAPGHFPDIFLQPCPLSCSHCALFPHLLSKKDFCWYSPAHEVAPLYGRCCRKGTACFSFRHLFRWVVKFSQFHYVTLHSSVFYAHTWTDTQQQLCRYQCNLTGLHKTMVGLPALPSAMTLPPHSFCVLEVTKPVFTQAQCGTYVQCRITTPRWAARCIT